MFSRIFKSARSLISSKSDTKKSQSPAPTPTNEMVKTRAKTQGDRVEEEELNEENSINVYVPTPTSNSRKRGSKRVRELWEDDEEFVETTPSSKKRKNLPVREKDVAETPETKTKVVVEIPLKKISPSANMKEMEIEDSTNESDASDAEESAAEADGLVLDEQVDEEEEKDDETPKKLKHKRFGSEEAGNGFFSTAREDAFAPEVLVISDDEEDEEDDSGDDAPETVGMQEAADAVKAKDREAALALKDQQEAARKKRKDRDAALKKKADKSRKRKRNTQVEPIPSIEEAVELPDLDTSLPDEIALPFSKVDIHNIPNILPAEYLEDDDVSKALTTIATPIKKKSKKTKFIDSSDKHPKDRRIGTTTYRVTKTSSIEMAPKSAFHARKTKEAWLQGRLGRSEETTRKPFLKGFLKK